MQKVETYWIREHSCSANRAFWPLHLFFCCFLSPKCPWHITEEIKSPGERCGSYVGVKVQCGLEQGLTKGICSVTVFMSVFQPMFWSTCSSHRKFDNRIHFLNTYQDKNNNNNNILCFQRIYWTSSFLVLFLNVILGSGNLWWAIYR